ncbi:Bacterial alpha-L-rhamnosidase [Agromyces sp. Q22]|uniref:alpha-L-rhamnosidase n=2 Tax=Agromyces kandeliae TaxID=2666141 RepID=A0A6L5R5F6_9MICO|nr:Bacterial alpha-L-rhamnosidase [Agromyces kandeliae]
MATPTDAPKGALPGTWKARMIGPDRHRDSAPRLRRSFRCDAGHGAVVSAEILATALGVCDVTLNGRPVTADVLTPGWSSYEWRLRYAKWDVTALVEPESVIAVTLGAGWYSGRLGFAEERALYGTSRAALLELRIHFEDGHVQTVATDESWESGPSEILSDDLYDGETIDARQRDDRWSRPGPAPEGWSGVVTVDFDDVRLTPYIGPPIRRQEELAPQRVWRSPAGATLIDFGQNVVGWTRLEVTGGAGHAVTLRHAEVLEHEEIGLRPLRTAKVTDRYVLSGGHDVFEPTLTFHGFRYVEVDGWPGSDDELATAIRAVVIGSDLERIGWFSCSDPLLNQLHSNIVWGMRGNFVDVPTDCPQRDERLGWTGDLSAFVGTAVYLYDVQSFLHDWLRDLAVEQEHAGGTIPLIVPDSFKLEQRQGMSWRLARAQHPVVALWHDAACWVPWAAWEAYGDLEVLRDEYPSMAAYAREIALAVSDDGLLRGEQFGDWLDPDAPPGKPGNGKTDPVVVATACVYRSAMMARGAADALGRSEDAAEFGRTAERLRRAFNTAFVSDGRVHSDSPTAYALAIAFDLLDESEQEAAGDRLAHLVREAGHLVSTGFAGTPFILPALSKTGHLETAYRLLMQTECPSWLYPVTMGATTVWERWDSMLPDGSINPGEMTSFNHYAFGAVGEWMHRVVAGIAPAEPGYRTISIAPRPGGGLTWARADLDTPHGRASVRWSIEHGSMRLEAVVPEGSAAVVDLPGVPDVKVGPGRHEFDVPLRTA